MSHLPELSVCTPLPCPSLLVPSVTDAPGLMSLSRCGSTLLTCGRGSHSNMMAVWQRENRGVEGERKGAERAEKDSVCIEGVEGESDFSLSRLSVWHRHPLALVHALSLSASKEDTCKEGVDGERDREECIVVSVDNAGCVCVGREGSALPDACRTLSLFPDARLDNSFPAPDLSYPGETNRGAEGEREYGRERVDSAALHAEYSESNRPRSLSLSLHGRPRVSSVYSEDMSEGEISQTEDTDSVYGYDTPDWDTHPTSYILDTDHIAVTDSGLESRLARVNAFTDCLEIFEVVTLNRVGEMYFDGVHDTQGEGEREGEGEGEWDEEERVPSRILRIVAGLDHLLLVFCHDSVHMVNVLLRTVLLSVPVSSMDALSSCDSVGDRERERGRERVLLQSVVTGVDGGFLIIPRKLSSSPIAVFIGPLLGVVSLDVQCESSTGDEDADREGEGGRHVLSVSASYTKTVAEAGGDGMLAVSMCVREVPLPARASLFRTRAAKWSLSIQTLHAQCLISESERPALSFHTVPSMSSDTPGSSRTSTTNDTPLYTDVCPLLPSCCVLAAMQEGVCRVIHPDHLHTEKQREPDSLESAVVVDTVSVSAVAGEAPSLLVPVRTPLVPPYLHVSYNECNECNECSVTKGESTELPEWMRLDQYLRVQGVNGEREGSGSSRTCSRPSRVVLSRTCDSVVMERLGESMRDRESGCAKCGETEGERGSDLSGRAVHVLTMPTCASITALTCRVQGDAVTVYVGFSDGALALCTGTLHSHTYTIGWVCPAASMAIGSAISSIFPVVNDPKDEEREYNLEEDLDGSSSGSSDREHFQSVPNPYPDVDPSTPVVTLVCGGAQIVTVALNLRHRERERERDTQDTLYYPLSYTLLARVSVTSGGSLSVPSFGAFSPLSFSSTKPPISLLCAVLTSALPASLSPAAMGCVYYVCLTGTGDSALVSCGSDASNTVRVYPGRSVFDSLVSESVREGILLSPADAMVVSVCPHSNRGVGDAFRGVGGSSSVARHLTYHHFSPSPLQLGYPDRERESGRERDAAHDVTSGTCDPSPSSCLTLDLPFVLERLSRTLNVAVTGLDTESTEEVGEREREGDGMASIMGEYVYETPPDSEILPLPPSLTPSAAALYACSPFLASSSGGPTSVHGTHGESSSSSSTPSTSSGVYCVSSGCACVSHRDRGRYSLYTPSIPSTPSIHPALLAVQAVFARAALTLCAPLPKEHFGPAVSALRSGIARALPLIDPTAVLPYVSASVVKRKERHPNGSGGHNPYMSRCSPLLSLSALDIGCSAMEAASDDRISQLVSRLLPFTPLWNGMTINGPVDVSKGFILPKSNPVSLSLSLSISGVSLRSRERDTPGSPYTSPRERERERERPKHRRESASSSYAAALLLLSACQRSERHWSLVPLLLPCILGQSVRGNVLGLALLHRY
ncbi:hypothetical protein KIPB_002044, partial [Kipferlia bialata]|eukprot:g2044.t1